MNAVHVILPLFSLWLLLIWAGTRHVRHREERERAARVERLDRHRRTITRLDRCERCGARRLAYSAEPMPRCEHGLTHQMVPEREGQE